MNRRLLSYSLAALVALAAVAVVAFTAPAAHAQVVPDGLLLDTTTTSTVCAVGGTALAVAPAEHYLAAATVETVWIVRAAACAAGGHPIQPGLQIKLDAGAEAQWCCRSAGGAGILHTTKQYPRR